MNNYSSIDLHHLNGRGQPVGQNEVWLSLDQFISKIKTQNAGKIKSGIGVKIIVIVGKGLQTKKFIQGKNPLRFYAESYINACGYSWRNGEYGEGESGVIVVEIV
ncbi:MAG: Smr/MutS family protein [bacterium]